MDPDEEEPMDFSSSPTSSKRGFAESGKLWHICVVKLTYSLIDPQMPDITHVIIYL